MSTALVVDSLAKHGRLLVCTEYMARTNGSLFQTIMPMLKEKNVGAINWGFVSGKMPSGEEPKLWFHDILRRDGPPFSQDEVNTIKGLTKSKTLPRNKVKPLKVKSTSDK